MAQTEQQAECFKMVGWQASAEMPAVSFSYDCSLFGRFSETVSFPSLSASFADRVDEGLASLLSLLQVALGVSYYKCAAAGEVILPAGAELNASKSVASRLYQDGLAEFYVRAGLPYPPKINFRTSSSNDARASDHSEQSDAHARQALVAYGGGKDSYVADAIVKKAGIKSRLCSAVMSDKVRDAIQRSASEPVIFMQRQLDPKLRQVNAAGAYNGHVPITAINSLMLVILGRLTSAQFVIFANERSADEPTIDLGDVAANHQYSKSSEFEAYLRDAIAAADPRAPEYFSILRPFSEIWIARAFANLKQPFGRFTSCNRNFQIAGEDVPRWCGACAKCAFTSLLLAPFLDREETTRIFPDNFLEKQALLPIYRELCGLTDNKPWDCVGTINECRAVIFRLGQMAAWQDSFIVRTLLPLVLNENGEEQLSKFWQDGLAAAGKHFVPEVFLSAAHDL